MGWGVPVTHPLDVGGSIRDAMGCGDPMRSGGDPVGSKDFLGSGDRRHGLWRSGDAKGCCDRMRSRERPRRPCDNVDPGGSLNARPSARPSPNEAKSERSPASRRTPRGAPAANLWRKTSGPSSRPKEVTTWPARLFPRSRALRSIGGQMLCPTLPKTRPSLACDHPAGGALWLVAMQLAAAATPWLANNRGLRPPWR